MPSPTWTCATPWCWSARAGTSSTGAPEGALGWFGVQSLGDVFSLVESAEVAARAADRVRQRQRAGDGPTGDGPTGDGPTGDGPTGDGPTGDGLTGDGLTGDGPAAP